MIRKELYLCIYIQYIYVPEHVSVSHTDRSFRAAGFNLVLSVYVVFPLKGVEPIDWDYMTDRLQRLELKILVCVRLKKQSHLHLRCLVSR